MPIHNYLDHKPSISETTFIAENATVVGNVTLEENTSVWFGAILRAELDSIRVGRNSNIQDNCVLHTDAGFPVAIDQGVTVGHAAVIHGARISSNCLIGMRSTILNGSKIGENCIVAAGSLITQGFEAPSNSLIMGSPAAVKRKITDNEVQFIQLNAEHYNLFRKAYLDGAIGRKIST